MNKIDLFKQLREILIETSKYRHEGLKKDLSPYLIPPLCQIIVDYYEPRYEDLENVPYPSAPLLKWSYSKPILALKRQTLGIRRVIFDSLLTEWKFYILRSHHAILKARTPHSTLNNQG